MKTVFTYPFSETVSSGGMLVNIYPTGIFSPIQDYTVSVRGAGGRKVSVSVSGKYSQDVRLKSEDYSTTSVSIIRLYAYVGTRRCELSPEDRVEVEIE